VPPGQARRHRSGTAPGSLGQRLCLDPSSPPPKSLCEELDSSWPVTGGCCWFGLRRGALARLGEPARWLPGWWRSVGVGAAAPSVRHRLGSGLAARQSDAGDQRGGEVASDPCPSSPPVPSGGGTPGPVPRGPGDELATLLGAEIKNFAFPRESGPVLAVRGASGCGMGGKGVLRLRWGTPPTSPCRGAHRPQRGQAGVGSGTPPGAMPGVGQPPRRTQGRGWGGPWPCSTLHPSTAPRGGARPLPLPGGGRAGPHDRP